MHADKTRPPLSLLSRHQGRAFSRQWFTPQIHSLVFQTRCPHHTFPSPLPLHLPSTSLLCSISGKYIPLSIDELLANLNTEEADVVQELLKSTVLDEAMEWNSSELKLDLHGMHLGTAYLILLQWFDELKLRFVDENRATPAEIVVVCGSGKHSSTRGESPVKDLGKQVMIRMKCPLKIDRKNIGCFTSLQASMSKATSCNPRYAIIDEWKCSYLNMSSPFA